MPSKVRVIAKVELNSMHTGTLLRRRTELLKCEESFEVSDRFGHEPVPNPAESGYIEFKNQPQWAVAYQDVKDVLADRDHLPTGEQRRQARMQQPRKSQ